VLSCKSTASKGYAVCRSAVFGVEVKNVRICTRTSSIRYAVDRSKLRDLSLIICGAVPLLPPYDMQLTAQLYLVLRLRLCGSLTTASIRYAVGRSTVSGIEFKNVWSCTSTAPIWCAIDRSTVSGAEVKNVWSSTSTASIMCAILPSNLSGS